MFLFLFLYLSTPTDANHRTDPQRCKYIVHRKCAANAPNFCGIELSEPYGRMLLSVNIESFDKFEKVIISPVRAIGLRSSSVYLKAFLVNSFGDKLGPQKSKVYSGSPCPVFATTFQFFWFADISRLPSSHYHGSDSDDDTALCIETWRQGAFGTSMIGSLTFDPHTLSLLFVLSTIPCLLPTRIADRLDGIRCR
jgi:hypothetical protein